MWCFETFMIFVSQDTMILATKESQWPKWLANKIVCVSLSLFLWLYAWKNLSGMNEKKNIYRQNNE